MPMAMAMAMQRGARVCGGGVQLERGARAHVHALQPEPHACGQPYSGLWTGVRAHDNRGRCVCSPLAGARVRVARDIAIRARPPGGWRMEFHSGIIPWKKWNIHGMWNVWKQLN